MSHDPHFKKTRIEGIGLAHFHGQVFPATFFSYVCVHMHVYPFWVAVKMTEPHYGRDTCHCFWLPGTKPTSYFGVILNAVSPGRGKQSPSH